MSSHRRPRRARRAGAVPEHAHAPAWRAGGVRSATDLRRGGEPLRALRPRAQEGQHPGTHGLPLIGGGRLERRHEPGRAWRAGERASGWPGSWRRRSGRSRTIASARRRRGRHRAAAPRGGATSPRWRSTAGTVPGTGAPISTTARRSGPRTSEECRIDSIAQSWSVISEADDPSAGCRRCAPSRSTWWTGRLASSAAHPAVRPATADPGYIKGYLPGVRENGAQYTHAALWAVLARAVAGTARGRWSSSRCSIR